MLRRSDYLLHQPCYAVIEDVQIVDPRMMLPISNLTSAAFLLVEETGVSRGNHRGVIRKLRKITLVMITDLTHCHWDLNPRPQRWMPSVQSNRPPRRPLVALVNSWRQKKMHYHVYNRITECTNIQVFYCKHDNAFFSGVMNSLMPLKGGVMAEWIGQSAFSAVVVGSNPSGSGWDL